MDPVNNTPATPEVSSNATASDLFSGSTGNAPETPVVETKPVTPVAAPTTPAVTPTAPTQQQLTPDQIADLATQAAARHAQANRPVETPAQQQGMSQEEFNKTFNVLNVDAKGFQDMFGFAPENAQQIANVNNAFQGAVKQAVKMATYLAGQEVAKLRTELTGQVAPIVNQQKNNRENALRQGFVAANADLKDYMPLVETIAKQMVTEGRKFQNETQLFSEVAKHVRGLLRMPTAQAAQGTVQTPQSQPNTRQMATVSTGGQSSGAPTTTSGRGAPSTAKTLFG